MSESRKGHGQPKQGQQSSSENPRTPKEEDSSHGKAVKRMPTKYNRVRVEDLLNAETTSTTTSRPRRPPSSSRRGTSSSGGSSISVSPDLIADIPCDVPHCKRTFTTGAALIAHKRRSHPAPTAFVCEHCHSSFSTPPNLNKHIRSVHKKVKPFKCEKCQAAFAFRDGLFRHTRMVHEQVRPFPCPYCQLRFKTKSHLLKHCSALHPNQVPPEPESKGAGSSAGH